MRTLITPERGDKPTVWDTGIEVWKSADQSTLTLAIPAGDEGTPWWLIIAKGAIDQLHARGINVDGTDYVEATP